MASHAHHDHGHSHSHGHGHHHAPTAFGRAFAVAIALNVGFVAVETVYGFIANSMSLLADAGHNLSDVLGLVVAWAAAVMARRAPSPKFTYGLKKAPILAALANSLFLLVAVGANGVPAAATRILAEIGARFDTRYADALGALRALRERLLVRGGAGEWERAAAQLIGDDFIERVEDGRVVREAAGWP